MMRITMLPSAILLLLTLSSLTKAFTIPLRLAAPHYALQLKSTTLNQSKRPFLETEVDEALNGIELKEQDAWKQRVEMKQFFEEVEHPTKDEKDVWNARFLLLGAAALYGTNFSVVKLLGEVMPVGAMGTLRFGLAALVTLPWLIAKPRPNSDLKTTVSAALSGIEVGMWASVGYVAQAVGLETTTASKSAFLCSMAVVIVPLLDRFMGKKLSLKQISGLAMAVLGVAFLELGGGPIEAFSTGDIASLVQPFAFGLGFWKMEQLMRAHPEEASRSTAAQLFAIFIASATYCVFGDSVPSTTQVLAWLSDPMILGALVWTGAITTALTVYMETLALKTLSAADTTLIFSTEPLWGAAFASVVMGEQFGPTAIAGGALILSGCLVSNLGIDGMRKLVQLPHGTHQHSIGRLASSGIAGVIGSWLATWTQDIEMVQATELEDIVEEVISKATDVL